MDLSWRYIILAMFQHRSIHFDNRLRWVGHATCSQTLLYQAPGSFITSPRWGGNHQPKTFFGGKSTIHEQHHYSINHLQTKTPHFWALGEVHKCGRVRLGRIHRRTSGAVAHRRSRCSALGVGASKSLWKLQSFEFRFTLPTKKWEVFAEGFVKTNQPICLFIYYFVLNVVLLKDRIHTISLRKKTSSLDLGSLILMFRSGLRNLPLSLEVGTPSASDHWIRNFVKKNGHLEIKLVSDSRVDETKLNAKASFEWNNC